MKFLSSWVYFIWLSSSKVISLSSHISLLVIALLSICYGDSYIIVEFSKFFFGNYFSLFIIINDWAPILSFVSSLYCLLIFLFCFTFYINFSSAIFFYVISDRIFNCLLISYASFVSFDFSEFYIRCISPFPISF